MVRHDRFAGKSMRHAQQRGAGSEVAARAVSGQGDVSLPSRLSRIMGAALMLAAALPLGACSGLFSKGPPATFDLTAPRGDRAGGAARGQLLVAEPSALAILDTERVVARPSSGQMAYLADVQWSDRLPRLLQSRILQTFENSSRLRAVGRPGERLTGDFQLVTDIRSFHIAATTEPVAEVEIAAKLVSDKTGRILGARVFRAVVPASATEGAPAVQAIDAAFGDVVRELVNWAAKLV
jgi:cholesterol transport system auxiliary component